MSGNQVPRFPTFCMSGGSEILILNPKSIQAEHYRPKPWFTCDSLIIQLACFVLLQPSSDLEPNNAGRKLFNNDVQCIPRLHECLNNAMVKHILFDPFCQEIQKRFDGGKSEKHIGTELCSAKPRKKLSLFCIHAFILLICLIPVKLGHWLSLQHQSSCLLFKYSRTSYNTSQHRTSLKT